MSPYLLPPGLVQVAFSGGRTSAFMLHQLLEANGGLPEDRVQVVFSNTGRERPETLDFVAEVERRWGVPITRVEYRRGRPGFEVLGHQGLSREGEPFEAMIQAQRYLPNQDQRRCTGDLKVKPAGRYLRARGWRAWTVARGFRADEQHRIDGKPLKGPSLEQATFWPVPAPPAPKRRRSRERWTPWHPLAAAGVTRFDVVAWWARQPFDLRLPTIRGKTIGGNCDGCFLKSERVLAALARDEPERHAWWERMETDCAGVATTPEAAHFSKRYSRASLRRLVEVHGDWILSDEAGLCQADDGECL